MNLLLDTQIFIWAYAYPHKLPERIGRALQNTENKLYLSVASSWEMQIKHQLGKLPPPDGR